MSKSLAYILLVVPGWVTGQFRIAAVFTDNMIMQRNQPIVLYGHAPPGQTVTVTMGLQQASGIAALDSFWKVSLPPQPATAFPQQLIIRSGRMVQTLKNVLIGDLWLCIGQSNMEWPMEKEQYYQAAIPKAAQPLLRFYNTIYAGKHIYGTPFPDTIVSLLQPATFFNGAWQECDSFSLKTMTAVGYYFGAMLNQELNIPIGLINVSIGGAPLETFINPHVLAQHPVYSAKMKGDWMQNDALPVWVRERGLQNLGMNAQAPGDDNGKNHPFKPGFVYRSGIEPLVNLPIKGILCYQGESNAQEIDRVNEYAALTALMVADYRLKWQQPSLPFYYVQLSSIDTLKYKSQLWPLFRETQRTIMELLPFSGMAVCTDIGAAYDVHPRNKREVGRRLARWALAETYHKQITASGPLPVSAYYRKGRLIVQFSYATGGLLTADAKNLRGFSVDGQQEVRAEISGRKVILSLSTKPNYLYYGWKPFSEANLINRDSLPASTFRLKLSSE